MHRMLIERMENRILVGVVAFVAIMVLVGWVAINENARMASFTRQYEARSVERGAALFAANCTSCHGTAGLGISNIAPALNNPALFGFDYIAETRKEMNDINRVNSELDIEKTDLAAELAAGGADAARVTAIAARLAEISAIQETGAARLVDLEATKQAFADSVVLAVDNGYTVDEPTRLGTLGWGGTLNAFIVTTLIHGRPTSESYWPQPMVAWSKTASGPLRDDQIQDIANYIQNWDKGNDWTLEDLLAVNQFPRIPSEGGGAVAPSADPIGTDVAAAVTQVADLTGDPDHGKQLYEGREPSQLGQRLSCSGCHYGGAAGPAYEGMWERIVNERLADPALAGQTPEHYVIDSILAPGDYIAPGWTAAMPSNYGTAMSAQDLADILQYIESTDPNYVAP